MLYATPLTIKREEQNMAKKKKPMGVEPFDVRKGAARRKGARVYRENPVMHNKYTEMFEKRLHKKLGGTGTPRKPKAAGTKVKTTSTRKRAKGGKIMQGYKAGGKV